MMLFINRLLSNWVLFFAMLVLLGFIAFSSSVVGFISGGTKILHAQEQEGVAPFPEIGPEGELPPPEGVDLTPSNVDSDIPPESSSTSCFDYYTFQSVQVAVGTKQDSYTTGETVSFFGEVMNENDHPVVDGNVFVRISKDNSENYRTQGHHVVDEFIAKEKMALNAGESKNIEFQWKVPEGTVGGSYRATFFFSAGKKFNLGGLPFTNEVIVGIARFDVTNGAQGMVQFDRSSTKVNGAQYTHVGGWPVIESGNTVEISQPIRNTSSEPKEITITKELYFWDGLDKNDLISTQDETITVPANSAQTVTYTIPSMEESVYYVNMVAQSDDTQSIVSVRLVSNDIARPRLNYPAITTFPIDQGDTFTLFSCYHNTSDSVLEEGIVVVSLYDKNNALIGKAEYAGSIGPEMSAIVEEIAAEKTYEYVRLEAQITNPDGKIFDEYEIVYECEDFNACAEETRFTFLGVSLGAGVILLVFIAFGILGIIFLRKKDKEERGASLSENFSPQKRKQAQREPSLKNNIDNHDDNT